MKKIIPCIFFILISILLIAENAKMDSLKSELKNVSEEKQVTILNELANSYRKVNIEKSYEYGIQALKLAEKYKNNLEKYKALNSFGYYFRHKKEHEKSIEYFHQALEVCRKLNDKEKTANDLDNIGHGYWFLGDYEIALSYYQNALEINLVIGKKTALAGSYNNIGSIYSRLGNYEKALDNLLLSLKIKEELGDRISIARTLNNLGNIFLRLKRYEKAVEYYERSLHYKKELKDLDSIAFTLNNIGNVYGKLKDYEQALSFYNQALATYEETDNKKGISTTFNNIAVIYEYSQDFDKVLDYYKRSLNLKKEIGDKYGFANTSKNIASLYLDKNEPDTALDYLKQSLECALEIDAKELIKDDYIILANIYEQLNDYEKAWEYEVLASTIKDSIFHENMSKEFAEMHVKYESEKKEREILSLQKEKEFQKKFQLWLLIIILLFLIFLVIIITLLIIKHHNNIKLQEQIFERERAEKELERYQQHLEKLVEERTSELKKSEGKYRSLVDNINDAVYKVNPKGYFTYVNKIMEEQVGITSEMFYSLKLTDIVISEDHKISLENFKKALDGEIPLPFEIKYKKSDGSLIIVETSITPIYDGKKVSMIQGISRDITQRKAAEEMFRKFEFIANTSIEFMSLINKDYIYETVNKAFGCTFKNLQPEEIIGKSVKQIWGEEQFSNVIKSYLDKCFTGKVIHCEAWFDFVDFGHRYFEVTYTPYKNEADEITHVVVIIRDSTNKKNLEDQLVRSERMASIGKLAAGIAHEIRNPLANINASAQLSIKKIELKEPIQDYLEIIMRNSNEANQIIMELLDFARPRELKFEDNLISDILENVIKNLKARFSKNKIKISKHFEKDIPKIKADKKWLEQAFQNIIINSIQAFEDGGNISVSTSFNSENEIIIVISDNGKGIPKNNLEKIFDPFFTTKDEGVGLGLALVHQIIEDHDGFINIESEIGKGTKVIIQLPKK
ncbi:MAG: tetratricopeptide repeat protein [Armatimonadetes bacterium]|nr:tetratricopeptide repeat protein [Armatimonadota bacterium]